MFPLCIIKQSDKQRAESLCVVDPDNINWPTCCGVCCWHCCHGFDTVPVPLPVNYDCTKDSFTVQGNFCSWGCAKAHLMDQHPYNVGRLSTILTLLHRRTVGHIKHIVRAPPRVSLQMFGGPFSIEEFRQVSASENVHHAPQNMVVISPNMIQTSTNSGIKYQPPRDVNIQGDRGNEPLRLKRNKPLKNSKNTLEKAMGLAMT